MPGQSFVKRVHKSGWRAVVFDRRTHGEEPYIEPLTPRTNNDCPPQYFNVYGDQRDMLRAIAEIGAIVPAAPLFVVGVSSGAVTLVRHLAENGSASPFRAAVSFAGAVDILKCQARVHWFFAIIFLARAKAFFVKRHMQALLRVDKEGVLACLRAKGLTEFLRGTAKMASHATFDEYLRFTNPSAVDIEGGIKTPTLFVHAMDDMISTQRNIDDIRSVFERNSNVALANSYTGGHCPFLEGAFALNPDNWGERTTMEFFQAVLGAGERDSSEARSSE
jgi:predicted alpha/beta-fold hydrolase